MDNRFLVIGKVGEGSFGTVFLAKGHLSGAAVALKRIRLRDLDELPTNALRELNALRLVQHPNLMPLLTVYTSGANIVLVMPFAPRSLSSVLATRDSPIPDTQARALGLMLLRGLHALHTNGVLHRDIKPQNILIYDTGQLQLADFGQSRLLSPDKCASLSHAVSTRWYRAPELLLGDCHYNTAVDIWSAGCVVCQLISLSPIFPGESDIDQLFRVVQILGSPTPASWPRFMSLPDYGKVQMPHGILPTPLRCVLPLASDCALHLINSMLKYDDRMRISCSLALRHPWVSSASAPASLHCLLDDRS